MRLNGATVLLIVHAASMVTVLCSANPAAISPECNTHPSMTLSECQVLISKWANHQCSVRYQPIKPVKWLGSSGCSANKKDGSGGCKTFCSCASILCRDLCVSNGCTWNGLSCQVVPAYFDVCNGLTNSPSVSPSISPTMTCFPGSARYRKPDGSFARMDELRVGDLVPAVDLARHGVIEYAPVVSFNHVERDGNYTMVRIEHERDAVEMTEDHRMFISESASEAPRDVAASQVRKGMFVWHLGQSSGLEPSRVIEVSNVTRQGIFNFFSPHGTILVESGTLVSVFAWPTALRFEHHRAVTVFPYFDVVYQLLGYYPKAVYGERPVAVGAATSREFLFKWDVMQSFLNTFVPGWSEPTTASS